MGNFRLFSFLPMIFLLCACICTEKLCQGFDHISEIQLFDFTASESDSIIVETFVAGSNYTDRKDSVFTGAYTRTYAGDTTLYILLHENILKKRNYKITFTATGGVYKVADLETRKEECNCPSDQYDVLESYTINGEQKINGALVIYK